MYITNYFPLKKLAKLKLVAFTLIIAIFQISCTKDSDSIPDNNVSITSFTPTTGRVGDEMIIYGTGFNTDPTLNTVNFKPNKNATIIEATSTRLKLIIPNSIQSGTIKITVNGKSVTSDEGFILDTSLGEKPIINSITPNEGYLGQLIQISGQYFSPYESLNVFIDDTEITTFENVTSSQIKFVLPDLPEGEYEVTVKRDGQISENSLPFTVIAPKIGVKALYFTDYFSAKSHLMKLEMNADGSSGNLTNLLPTSIFIDPVLLYVDSVNEYLYFNIQGFKRCPISNPDLVQELNQPYAFSMAVNPATDILYAATTHQSGTNNNSDRIVSSSLNETNVQTLITLSTDNTHPEIKLDTQNQKLYWTTDVERKVSRISINQGPNQTEEVLYDFSNTSLYTNSIEIDPEEQKIYISVFGPNNYSAILVGDIDGNSTLTELTVTSDITLREPRSLQLDTINNTLYFLNTRPDDSLDFDIVKVDLDSDNFEMTIIYPNIHLGIDLGIEFGIVY